MGRTPDCETAGLDLGAGARAYVPRSARAFVRSSSKPLRFAFMPRYPTRILSLQFVILRIDTICQHYIESAIICL